MPTPSATALVVTDTAVAELDITPHTVTLTLTFLHADQLIPMLYETDTGDQLLHAFEIATNLMILPIASVVTDAVCDDADKHPHSED